MGANACLRLKVRVTSRSFDEIRMDTVAEATGVSFVYAE
jgi:hypothetical protein